MNAVIIYHKNVHRYPNKWIDDCMQSIRQQVVEKFEVYELNYGGEKDQIYEGSKFYSQEMNDHAQAHNFLCREAVFRGCENVFNTNVDDFYHHERMMRQMPYLNEGYDVVSCNMTQIDAGNTVIRQDIDFSNMPILEHAQRGHNVIAHPGCAYSANFIRNSGLLRSEEIPADDFNLWKRSFGKFRFAIVPYTLLFYRIHGSNVSAKKQVK